MEGVAVKWLDISPCSLMVCVCLCVHACVEIVTVPFVVAFELLYLGVYCLLALMFLCLQQYNSTALCLQESLSTI